MSADIENSNDLSVESRPVVPVVSGSNQSPNLISFGQVIRDPIHAKEELVRILDDSLSADDAYRLGRIQYLISVLENSFIPIQTLPFLNMAIEGYWELKYSSMLLSKRSNVEM